MHESVAQPVASEGDELETIALLRVGRLRGSSLTREHVTRALVGVAPSMNRFSQLSSVPWFRQSRGSSKVTGPSLPSVAVTEDKVLLRVPLRIRRIHCIHSLNIPKRRPLTSARCVCVFHVHALSVMEAVMDVCVWRW